MGGRMRKRPHSKSRTREMRARVSHACGFVQLALGKLNPQTAFMKGKMKIKGNMKAALKFKPDMIPKDAAL